MFDITNHQGNANQNDNEISPQTSQMAIITKTKNNKCWRGCGVKGMLINWWWECKPVRPLWKTVCKFLKNLKTEILYDPAILLLGIYQKNMKSLIQKDICTRMLTTALFTIGKMWKQPRCPSRDKWIRRCCICIQWNTTHP
uniref:Uncharacterized protein n=1 Tax=Equus caballus TaxID=9796 RepID=A0A9L0TIP9_HORSE